MANIIFLCFVGALQTELVLSPQALLEDKITRIDVSSLVISLVISVSTLRGGSE